jgi:CRP/FNR family transcriptional regulator, cyclic AMP receptor protein
MDSGVEEAFARSCLGGLARPIPERLLAGARVVTVEAGSYLHLERERRPHVDLVVSGIARVLLTDADGHTVSVRYCRPGALIGVMSLSVRPFSLPADIQALVGTEVLRLQPEVVREAARTDVRVANALLVEQSERAFEFLVEIRRNVFTTVRQRVGRHLLDLASERLAPNRRRRSAALVAAISQRELAESVGTAREVVVRVLHDLREEDLVRTGSNRIEILDPARLVEEQMWNPGS